MNSILNGVSHKERVLVLHPDYEVHRRFSEREDVDLLFRPRDFNMVVDRLRTEYSQYIDVLSRTYGDNIDWWVSSVASRNTVQSAAFLNLAYLVYFDTLLQDQMGVDLVLCASRGLKRCVESVIERRGGLRPRVSIIHGSGAKNALKQSATLRHGITMLGFFLESGHRKLSAWVSRLRVKSVPLQDPLVLLDTFVIDSDFRGGSYRDRYFSSFADPSKFSFTYLPTFLTVKKHIVTFVNMRKSIPRFLVKEDFLRIRDYVWAALYLMRVRLLPKPFCEFRSLPVRSIFQEDLYQNSGSSSLESLLTFRLFRRMAEKHIDVSTVVDWFENQNLDKALNLAVHKYYPGAKTIGYQAFNVSSNYLCVHPTEGETGGGVVPSVIAVGGRGNIERIAELNPGLNAVTVPAFRFQHLWLEDRDGTVDKSSILIALPIMLPESLEILSVVSIAMGKLPKNLKFAIKVHPTVDRQKLIQFLKLNEMDSIPIWDEPFSNSLKKSTLLISSTSSVIMEAMSRGIPVVVIGSLSQITHNPIPANLDRRVWSVCYAPDELAQAVLRHVAADKDRKDAYIRAGESIRESYFEPVTEAGTARFLSLIGA